MHRTATAAMALAAFFAASALPAAAYERQPNACTDPGLLASISHRFDYQVRNVPNLPQVAIVAFEGVHERRTERATGTGTIARRYCGATALMTDGHRRDMWFLVEDGMGFAGMGDGVEFCVSGFDRWSVYNGACRVLR